MSIHTVLCVCVVTSRRCKIYIPPLPTCPLHQHLLVLDQQVQHRECVHSHRRRDDGGLVHGRRRACPQRPVHPPPGCLALRNQRHDLHTLHQQGRGAPPPEAARRPPLPAPDARKHVERVLQGGREVRVDGVRRWVGDAAGGDVNDGAEEGQGVLVQAAAVAGLAPGA